MSDEYRWNGEKDEKIEKNDGSQDHEGQSSEHYQVTHNYSCGQQFHRNFDMGVSQACRPDIFQGVSSEGEGIALVKKTAKFLIKERKPWLLAELFFQSAFKYAGYFLGKRYRCFPMWFIKFCTMNRSYWEQKEEN